MAITVARTMGMSRCIWQPCSFDPASAILLSSMCSREAGSMQHCHCISLACHAWACTALDEHLCLMRIGSQQCRLLPL